MKRQSPLLPGMLLAIALLLPSSFALAESVPELIHYRFDGSGTSVPHLASDPPAGAETAVIRGSIVQDGPDLTNLGTGTRWSAPE